MKRNEIEAEGSECDTIWGSGSGRSLPTPKSPSSSTRTLAPREEEKRRGSAFPLWIGSTVWNTATWGFELYHLSNVGLLGEITTASRLTSSPPFLPKNT